MSRDRRVRRARARAAASDRRSTAAARAERDVSPRAVALVGGAVGAILLVAYLATAARDLVYGDSPELVAVAVTLGVAHAPGYPLWTMLANIFTHIPVDSYSFRVSLFSALAATGAALVSFATAYRIGRSTIAAGVAALLLGVTPVVWAWSIVPEVFALHALLGAALVGLLVLWHERGQPAAFVAAAFVGGLGLAHQQTIVLAAPFAVALMWSHRNAVVRDRLLWKGALALIAGLLPYAYLPLAAASRPAWNFGDISTSGDLVAQILRTDLGSGQLIADRALQGGSTIDRLIFYVQSFDAASALLIAIGLAALFRRDRALFWAFGLASLLCGPAFVLYANVDVNAVPVLRALLERFFILSHVIVAPVAAVGLNTLAEWSEARVHRTVSTPLAVVATAFALFVAAADVSRIDQHDNHNARHFAEDFLATVPPGKVLLASGDAIIWPIGYLHTIEGARPDVTVLDLPLLTFGWYVRQAAREHPELVFRAAKYDGRVGTGRDLVEPNGADRFVIAGGLIDDSLNAAYTFPRRGLLVDLRPSSAQIDVDAVASLSDLLLRTYRIPRPAAVAGRYWDSLTLGDYGLIAYDIGRLYETRGATAQARTWYTRAISIYPDFVEARTALTRLPR